MGGLGTSLLAQTWTVQGPASRNSHTAVFDPTTQQMIIFGGQQAGSTTDLNDTWLGVTDSDQDDGFTQLLPTGTLPAARYGHIATYDSVNNRMTVFGGATGSPITCENDVWILTGANGQNGTPAWSQASPTGTLPSARVYAAGAYDPNTNTLMVYGGYNCATAYSSDVWVLSNANGIGAQAWTKLKPSTTSPPARESASAVYDSVNNILTIYAGDAGGRPFHDVWVLSHANGTGGTPAWTQLSPSGKAPNARTGQTAIYDSASDRMTIFGGVNGANTIYDSWVLTAANGIGTPSWILLSAASTAPSLSYQSAVYNSTADTMLVFGGSSSANKLQPQSHAFLLSNANGLGSTEAAWTLGGPAARFGQTGFYDSVTNNWFVFGGEHASSDNLNFNDYWEATDIVGSSNLVWNKLQQNGTTPSARYGQTGLYDSVSDRLMIFGGATASTKCKNDYYVLKYANYQGGVPKWVTVTPTGTAPAARTFQASAYAGATNTLMLFGGYGCASNYYNDVWILSNANDESTPIWTELSPSGTGPSVRESASAVYDPTTNSLILYGGDSGETYFDDVWLLSNANGLGGTPVWTELQPSNSGPVARSGQTAIYDSVNNLMTIYGGYNGTVLSDVWILSNANGEGTPSWSQSTAGQPRRFASSSYDASTNEMITFGGASDFDPETPTSDLHILSDANGLPGR
jgi:hypothetical protein